MQTRHAAANRSTPGPSQVTASSVRLTLLGVPRVEADGVSYDLTLDRPTSLMAVLALRGDWVRRSELATLYRPDDDDRHANAYLRKLVFRARQAPWAAGLLVDGSRLRWDVVSDVAELRAHAAAGRHEHVVALYCGALLAHADLPDVAGFQALVEVERDELHRRWRSSSLHHARSCEEVGATDEALRCLERVLQDDPLDEEAVQARLRLLLAQGRHHDAWLAFERFRGALAAELGIEPLEATLTLADLARRGDPVRKGYAMEAVADVAQGARGTAGPVPVGAAEARSEATAAWLAVDGPLVGRDDELARIERWWREGAGRWVTITGLGGVGKTRLATELVRRAVSSGESVAVAACEGLEHVDSVMLALLLALGSEPAGAQPPSEQVRRYLERHPTLVVLDDLELGVSAAVALALGDLPKGRVVATSRQPLDVPDAWWIDLPGLASPPADATTDLTTYAAVRFFLLRSERRAAVPQTDATSLAAIAELCRRVDGLPLALELATTWTRLGSVASLLEHLDRDVARLSAAADDVPVRHRDIEAVIGATLGLLTPDEEETLVGLTAYGAGFGLWVPQRTRPSGLASLLRLINLGLVRRTPVGRYQVHALVRSVVWSRAGSQRRAAAHREMRARIAGLLREGMLDLKYRDEREAVQRLTPELDAVRVAWQDALASADADAIDAMEEALYLLLDVQGAYHAGAAAFEAALAATGRDATGEDMSVGSRAWGAPAFDVGTVRRLRARAGYFAMRLGRTERATAYLKAAMVAEGVDTTDVAFVVHNLGVLDLMAGRHDEAHARFQRALATYAQVDDDWGVSRAANNLGAIATLAGDGETALGWGRRAMEASERIGNHRGVAGAAINLGIASESLGSFDEAVAYYRTALETYRKMNDPRGESSAWTNLGHVAERRGDDHAAREAYERSLTLKRDIGDPIATSISLANLADVLVRLGEAARARANIVEALRLTHEAGAATYVARALWSVVKERMHSGDRDGAARALSAIEDHPASEGWLRAEAAALRSAWPDEAARARTSPTARTEGPASGVAGSGSSASGIPASGIPASGTLVAGTAVSDDPLADAVAHTIERYAAIVDG